MKHYGFVKTAAVTPKVKVADVAHNVAEIEKYIEQLKEEKKIPNNICFPKTDLLHRRLLIQLQLL